MTKFSNGVYLSTLTKLLVLLVVAKALSLVLWAYLPSEGVELSIKQNYQPPYQRVDFKNMILTTKVVKVKQEKSITGINITNMLLKGLYGNSSKGFVILALKSSPKKSSIIGLGEDFSGFTLQSISSRSVLFVKAGKEYVLELEEVKNKKSYVKRVKKRVSVTAVSTSDEPNSVSRKDIASYAKNPKQIWRDISIREVKQNGKITGFRVNRIAKNSPMAQLGLQKGDIIIRANNIELKSYRDALNIYAKIDKIDTIQIVVMRNNQEQELVYEIN